MPRRPHLSRRLAALPLLALLTPLGTALAGCGATPPPPQAERAACSSLVRALPARLGGVTVRRTAYEADWGSFRLSCGVGRPHGLTATSECLSVGGVDWFAPPNWYDDPGADVDLTTVSLRPRTQLHVAARDRGGAAAAALADLAPVLTAHLSPARHCQ